MPDLQGLHCAVRLAGWLSRLVVLYLVMLQQPEKKKKRRMHLVQWRWRPSVVHHRSQGGDGVRGSGPRVSVVRGGRWRQ